MPQAAPAGVLALAAMVLITVSTAAAARPSKSLRVGVDDARLQADQDPHPTYAGYIPVDQAGSELYYAYWEAQDPHIRDYSSTPIILWLQGGPGCASTFGGFYEIGPYLVSDDKFKLYDNPGSWAWSHGLLLIDQPLGTGYSRPANSSAIPRDELGMATHLYTALNAFFSCHFHDLGSRPLFIIGESYGGKYIPSIAHYYLQAQDLHASAGAATDAPATHVACPRRRLSTSETADANSDTGAADGTDALEFAELPHGSGHSALLPASGGSLRVWRRLTDSTPRPIFRLAGIAIGNGLTDPHSQVPVMSEAAHYMGLVSPALRQDIAWRSQEVLAAIDAGHWREAHDKREALRTYIVNVTGIATMFDTRRWTDYDPQKRVDAFLNIPIVKRNLNAHPQVEYKSCNKEVGEIMAEDTMQSVKHLLPDILNRLPVLLYQGQFDILDGVASSIAWIDSLDWALKQQLTDDKGTLWHHRGDVAGWKRRAGRLVHAVVYKAGHMVPADQPGSAEALIDDWITDALTNSK